jgi:hypothetical protein
MMTPIQEQPPTSKKMLRRFDLVVLASILAIAMLIGIVLWQGDRTIMRVTEFSWKEKTIGVGDRWFTLTFNRHVDRESIAQNLVIEPYLAGKISWAGRKLAYTLSELPIYGNTYRISLAGAKIIEGDRVGESFASAFKTRDRAFIYIGMADEEKGQLILINVTQKTKNSLTPRDLIVTHFEIYPDSDKVLFSAFERGTGSQGFDKQQLYTVSTGLDFQSSKSVERMGRIHRLLDAKTYQNFKFDLSDNGKTIVIQRVNRNNPADSGLWVIPEGGQPRPLGLPGTNFVVAPDGNTLAVAQRGGIATVPLNPDGQASQFWQGYEAIVGFAKNGLQPLMVKDNADYTRSLVLVNQDGSAKELFQTLTPIVNCQLEPRETRILYCLKTGLVQKDKEQVSQEAFLAAIDLETANEVPVLVLPNYRDVRMSMSPDGVALLFDQPLITFANANVELRTDSGETIISSSLWSLPLPELETVQSDAKPPEVSPEELGYPGFKPQWLP